MAFISNRQTPASALRGSMLWLIALLLTAAVNVVSDTAAITYITGMLLLTFFPGALLVRLIISREDFDVLSRIMLAVGLSLVLNCLGYFVLCYVIDQVTRPVVIGMIIGYAFLFLLLYQWKRPGPRPRFKRPSLWTALAFAVLILGAALRLTHLGYSDYIGDEAGNCMTNSLELVRGHQYVLLEPIATGNRRPPTQVLIPALSYLLTRTFDEGVMRFPFALAGLAAIWLMYILGREFFKSPLGGLVACFLSAINGYFLIFSRLVQYQSIVILLMILSALFFWRFMKYDEQALMSKYLFLGTLFFSFSVFTHYEGLLFLPAAVFALVYKGRRAGWKNCRIPLAGSCLLFLVITALFYIPFFFIAPGSMDALSTHWHTRHDASLHFNADLFSISMPFYISKAYMIALIVLSLFSFFTKNRALLGFIGCWFLMPFIYYVVICSTSHTHVYT
ncbi:MAG: glycosyltransferase family 39 protein, partial [Deltaproteobacteria bacterium]|nr:glycosyltransferase family 39 protein [Deltaproteobacteria bacterium]